MINDKEGILTVHSQVCDALVLSFVCFGSVALSGNELGAVSDALCWRDLVVHHIPFPPATGSYINGLLFKSSSWVGLRWFWS